MIKSIKLSQSEKKSNLDLGSFDRQQCAHLGKTNIFPAVPLMSKQPFMYSAILPENHNKSSKTCLGKHFYYLVTDTLNLFL